MAAAVSMLLPGSNAAAVQLVSASVIGIGAGVQLGGVGRAGRRSTRLSRRSCSRCPRRSSLVSVTDDASTATAGSESAGVAVMTGGLRRRPAPPGRRCRRLDRERLAHLAAGSATGPRRCSLAAGSRPVDRDAWVAAHRSARRPSSAGAAGRRGRCDRLDAVAGDRGGARRCGGRRPVHRERGLVGERTTRAAPGAGRPASAGPAGSRPCRGRRPRRTRRSSGPGGWRRRPRPATTSARSPPRGRRRSARPPGSSKTYVAVKVSPRRTRGSDE